MKVDVYYNLHKDKLSVKSRERKNYGKVIDHVDTILLENCSFVVNPAGRNRVLKEKRKNVHAFVRGNISSKGMKIKNGTCRTVRYDPYEYDSFVFADSEEPVFNAEAVAIIGKKIIAYNPT